MTTTTNNTETTTYAGLDYGLGRTNIDRETGIRYGVISQHTVGERWYEDAEADYGQPTCPKCSRRNIPIPIDEGKLRDGDQRRCLDCYHVADNDECFPDEPLGYSYTDDDYQLVDCLDSDIMVLKSPYFTHAQFCSPCVPGAGNLDSPLDGASDTNKCYCLGHDWFESGQAPYRVWSVETGQEVTP